MNSDSGVQSMKNLEPINTINLKEYMLLFSQLSAGQKWVTGMQIAVTENSRFKKIPDKVDRLPENRENRQVIGCSFHRAWLFLSTLHRNSGTLQPATRNLF